MNFLFLRVKIGFMKQAFLINGITVTDEQYNEYKEFCNFLLRENLKYNVTAIREENQVFIKHFADSLMGKDYFSGGKKIIEIGSGGGFPSVPLKIYNKNLNLTLVEATGKKCEFLKAVKQRLAFENFEVINARCEQLAFNCAYREQFDVVTARAVAELKILLELCVPFLKQGGKCVFYKNYSEEEINSAKNALKELNCAIKEIKKYTLLNVDGEVEVGERAVIIVEKSAQTPQKYPREYKKILKRPL